MPKAVGVSVSGCLGLFGSQGEVEEVCEGFPCLFDRWIIFSAKEVRSLYFLGVEDILETKNSIFVIYTRSDESSCRQIRRPPRKVKTNDILKFFQFSSA